MRTRPNVKNNKKKNETTTQAIIETKEKLSYVIYRVFVWIVWFFFMICLNAFLFVLFEKINQRYLHFNLEELDLLLIALGASIVFNFLIMNFWNTSIMIISWSLRNLYFFFKIGCGCLVFVFLILIGLFFWGMKGEIERQYKL